jgi:hypothetical protein
MKRSLRSAAKRAGAPVLGPLDRRFAEFAEQQRKELERLDERLEIDLRILDEHLLAIRRTSRRIEDADRVHAAAAMAVEQALAGDGDQMVVVVPLGTDLAMPEGFEVVGHTALLPEEDGGWRHPDHDATADDAATLRIVRLRRARG